MMEEPAISIDNVSKAFRLPHEKQTTIKGAMIGALKGNKRTYEQQQVLKDISFDIKKGEFFGIVGRNGSGKSTLLKMLAGIYTPTTGNIEVHGKLTPFIELGVGFNPELTGRENVFLNGALLGFSRKEMEAMYDDIVSFAELEKFMDQKLKNYSSGMQVRLAFSIAIRANTDILVLDEVLAVGDESFQRKCFNYFDTLKKHNKTVVLVTHDMTAVERFCTRAMLIEKGSIVKIGEPFKVSTAYSKSNAENYSAAELVKTQKNKAIQIELKTPDGKPTDKYTSGDRAQVHIQWQNKDVKQVGVAIFKLSGEYMFGTNTYIDKVRLMGGTSVKYSPKLNLTEGDYFIQVGLFDADATTTIEFEENGPVFTVNRNSSEGRWGGMVKLDHDWIV